MGVDRGAVGAEPQGESRSGGALGLQGTGRGRAGEVPRGCMSEVGTGWPWPQQHSRPGFWSWADFPRSQARLRLPPGGHSLQSSVQKAVLGPVAPKDE